MNTKIGPSEYFNLCERVYSLIDQELRLLKDPEMQYPKLIIMYEFFRLLRGEAFLDQRESLGENQKRLYQMEDELKDRLDGIKDKIKPESQRAKFYLEIFKKDFDLY